MVDTVTNNFSLVQPAVGGDLNLWGGILNNGTIAAIDATLGANLAVTVNTTDVTLTTSQFQNAIFVVSGALTGNHSLILPLSPNSATVAVGGRFVIANNTTGAYNLTIETAASGSTGVTVPQGFTALLYSDGTNVGYGTLGLPGFAAAVNGNPNGQLAGTAASVNTNASLAFDYTNNILYVCITTGDSTNAVWINAVSASLPQPEPQGYLTPVSNTPIITGDALAATVIYYTPFLGTWTAIHDGTSVVPYRFSQMSLTLTSSQAANNIYDIYLAYNGGVPVIGTGPSWASGAGGSVAAGSCARGTGAGGAAINRDSLSGLWVNTESMSLIYNTGSGNNTITVAAGQGIYLGSIYMDGTAGQVTCTRSYGQNRKWGIFNAYNAVLVYLKAGDPTASWNYATNTWRPSDNNAANSLTVFQGLPQSYYDIDFVQYVQAYGLGSCTVNIGIGYNSTTAPVGTIGSLNEQNSNVVVNVIARYLSAPTLGINVITALENTTNAVNQLYYGTETRMLLSAKWEA